MAIMTAALRKYFLKKWNNYVGRGDRGGRGGWPRLGFAATLELCWGFSINDSVICLFHLDQCFSVGVPPNHQGEGVC